MDEETEQTYGKERKERRGVRGHHYRDAHVRAASLAHTHILRCNTERGRKHGEVGG